MVAFYKDILRMKVKHELGDSSCALIHARAGLKHELGWLSTKEGSTKLALHLTEELVDK